MPPGIRSYRDLLVWQRSMALADDVGRFCAAHAQPGRYSLIDQLQRAADSVPANIAEGYGRYTRRDYVRFVTIANGSLKELETRLLRARARIPGTDNEVDGMLQRSDEIGRMLAGLIRALRGPKKNSAPTEAHPPAEARPPSDT